MTIYYFSVLTSKEEVCTYIYCTYMTTPAIVFGILAVLVFLYRFAFLLIPMLLKGIQTKDLLTIFNSLTMLV